MLPRGGRGKGQKLQILSVHVSHYNKEIPFVATKCCKVCGIVKIYRVLYLSWNTWKKFWWKANKLIYKLNCSCFGVPSWLAYKDALPWKAAIRHHAHCRCYHLPVRQKGGNLKNKSWLLVTSLPNAKNKCKYFHKKKLYAKFKSKRKSQSGALEKGQSKRRT